jgi:hypothetical protein
MKLSPANSALPPLLLSPATHFARISKLMVRPISRIKPVSNAAPHAMFEGNAVATPFQDTPWSASASQE